MTHPVEAPGRRDLANPREGSPSTCGAGSHAHRSPRAKSQARLGDKTEHYERVVAVVGQRGKVFDTLLMPATSKEDLPELHTILALMTIVSEGVRPSALCRSPPLTSTRAVGT
jgi:hypothetical protein